MFLPTIQSYILQDINVPLHLCRLFWELFAVISQEKKAFASNSRPHLTIQCLKKNKERKRKEKIEPEAE